MVPELEARPAEEQAPPDEVVAELRLIRTVLENIRLRMHVLIVLVAVLMIGLLIAAILVASYAGNVSNQLGL